ncbi:hypothetical protein Peur_050349 [Populus x canadensis]
MLMMIQNYLSFRIENFILGAYHKKLTLNLDLFSTCKRLYQYISKPEMVPNI